MKKTWIGSKILITKLKVIRSYSIWFFLNKKANNEKKIKTFVIIFYAETQVDLDEKIGDVLKYVDGLKSDLLLSDITESQDMDGLKSDLSESDITSQDFDGLKSDLSGSDIKESQDIYNLVDTFKNEIHKETM